MIGLLNRLLHDVIQNLKEKLATRQRRAAARADPDLQEYVEDLEAAGAEVINAIDDESGPRIYAEFSGEWVDLQQRVELEYRLIDEMPSAGKTSIALRPGPG